MLVPAGHVQFGLARKGYGGGSTDCVPATRTVPALSPVRPELVAAVHYFGRYRTGWMRDGVLLSAG